MSSKRKYKLKDYSGKTLSKLTILRRNNTSEEDTALTATWLAHCSCGNEVVLTHKEVSGRKKRTCGCGLRTSKYDPGCTYGELTIIKEGPKSKVKGGYKRQVWCKCSCGNPDLTLVATNNLVSGNTTSCGCYGKGRRIKHGMSSSRTYTIWEGMLRRCRPENSEMFPHHAGKGITVCAEWDTRFGGSFENFFKDMGEAPEGLSLDRKDYRGNYCRDNCRWADNSLQGYNKGLAPNNRSGKSGVSFYVKMGKWSAEIYVNNEHIRLGYFTDKEDAIAARKAAEIKYFGFNKP